MIRKQDDRTFLSSSVVWVDHEGKENRRIVLNIADENWDSFLEFWGKWAEKSHIDTKAKV